MDKLQNVESAFLDQLVTLEHIMLTCIVLGVILMLKKMRPLKDTLFSDKWKWMVAPINVVLSTVGVFLLKLTTFETVGMKVAVIVIISALVTFSYESVFKYVLSFGELVVEWIRKKLTK